MTGPAFKIRWSPNISYLILSNIVSELLCIYQCGSVKFLHLINASTLFLWFWGFCFCFLKCVSLCGSVFSIVRRMNSEIHSCDFGWMCLLSNSDRGVEEQNIKLVHQNILNTIRLRKLLLGRWLELQLKESPPLLPSSHRANSNGDNIKAGTQHKQKPTGEVEAVSLSFVCTFSPWLNCAWLSFLLLYSTGDIKTTGYSQWHNLYAWGIFCSLIS